MAKRSGKPNGKFRGKKPPVRRGKTSHRVTTFKANGSAPESTAVPTELPVEEAMRQAVADLGDVHVDPGLAPTQMLELAETYEDVAKAQAAFARKSEAAKVAKKHLDSIVSVLLEKVRSFTHPKALPLFDQAERETDQTNMLEAAERGGAEA